MVNLDEDVILTGSGLNTVIWIGWLTKTNRENINVKYNIWVQCILWYTDERDRFNRLYK